MSFVITLSGKSESGKDTSADYLIEKINKQYPNLKIRKVGLADRLKKICRQMIFFHYGVWIPFEDFYDKEAKERERPEIGLFQGEIFKLRTYLQIIGTEIFRDMIWPDIWCDIVNKEYLHEFDILIITDCRFSNEKNYFEGLWIDTIIKQFISIKLIRNEENILSKKDKGHRSETSLNEIETDFIIKNNFTLDRLYQELDNIYETFDFSIF